MAETFTCPNCAGNLQHDGGDHLTVQCPYCNSTVIVPENMRPRAHQQNFAPLLAQQQTLQRIIQHINNGQMDEATRLYQQTYGVGADAAADGVRRLAAGLSLATTHMQISTPQTVEVGRRAGCWVTALILLIVGAIGASVIVPLVGGGAALWAIFSSAEDGGPPAISVNIPDMPTIPAFEVEIPGFISAESSTAVTTLFEMGERGINPGQFNDARALAVGGDGVIYVADRQSGRLQLFASDGTHQTTWPWDKEGYTDDLEIDRNNGVLYAQQVGDIFRYDLSSGELLGEVPYTEDIAVSFENLALTLDGELLAINGVRNTIVRFDPQGNVLQTIAAETIPSAVSFDNIAVDGLGNIYVVGVANDVLGDRQDVIFKFTPEGQFASQFGSSGDEPGTFMGIVSAIAVDGQGRIYVADFLGIQIFDNNGRYLDLIKLDGVARDMAFNGQGELVAISSENKLYKFDVSQIGE
ncbi:MAG: NHL repeat-containing protein [Ardenticatenaceae bacterium]|nr:NHL repeat-containing protein [Anaerolineales bacterium]MCB8920261.1 NHL repeat-containing protein [Ardenticatenaceae bacterium]MCB9004933.1 NHL repeat-containing protein [Ardenticatenaceae bacterium]